jgi:hypothetical protein
LLSRIANPLYLVFAVEVAILFGPVLFALVVIGLYFLLIKHGLQIRILGI